MEDPERYNAAVDLVDRNVEAGREEKPAFIDSGRSLTYGNLLDGCARMAGLLNELGLRRESRIAMLMLDTVDFPIIFLGTIRAGVVPIPLNTLLPAEQYEYILADCRAEALFVSPELLSTVEPILGNLPFLRHVIVAGEGTHQYHDFSSALEAQTPNASPAGTHADETAFWLYSSGSTGTPKGVLHVQSSAMENGKALRSGCCWLPRR